MGMVPEAGTPNKCQKVVPKIEKVELHTTSGRIILGPLDNYILHLTGYAAKVHMCYAEVRGTPVIKRLTFERAGTLGVRRWISRSELEWRRSEIPSIENALWC